MIIEEVFFNVSGEDLLAQGYRYIKLRKTFGKFFRSYSELLLRFFDIPFQEYVSKGISQPFFYGDLVYKPMRSKIHRISPRRLQKYLNAFEMTVGLVLDPSTDLA